MYRWATLTELLGKHHYRSDYWDLVGLDAMGRCQERGLARIIHGPPVHGGGNSMTEPCKNCLSGHLYGGVGVWGFGRKNEDGG